MAIQSYAKSAMSASELIELLNRLHPTQRVAVYALTGVARLVIVGVDGEEAGLHPERDTPLMDENGEDGTA